MSSSAPETQIPAPVEKSPHSEPTRASTVIGMGACYALGTFTDNFYKQAAVLMAASMGLTWVQSVATILFALPFIFFSAGAGWLADRMVKKHIVVIAKVVELCAMLAGAFFLVSENWVGILVVIFFMGTQATVFSPALNGSIPEIFPTAEVPKINSFIKLGSTIAVLMGIAGAGVLLDNKAGVLSSFGIEEGATYGRACTGVFAFIVAVFGVVTAVFLQHRPAALAPGSQGRPFPWSGPVDSWRHFLECRKDEQLFLVLLAEGYFYGVAAMAVVSVANLAKHLGYSATIASLLSASLMVGIAVGALIAGRCAADSWKRLLLPAATGMSISLVLVAVASYVPKAGSSLALLNPQLCWLWATLFACGVCGGIYLIPLASFIQVRPPHEEKGKVLGVSNFISFVFIAAWGIVFAVVGLLPSALTFVFYGIATLCFTIGVVGRRLRHMSGLTMQDAAASTMALFLRSILWLRYRVTEKGLSMLPVLSPCGDTFVNSSVATVNASNPQGNRPILFLPNHPALIDPLLVYSRIAGLAPRPLADESQMRGFLQGTVARMLNVVTMPDAKKMGHAGSRDIRLALDSITEALQHGDNVLLYPAGRLYRTTREELGANSAVAHILAAVPEARVVLVRTSGLWGSRFSYAHGTAPQFMRQLVRGALTVLANFVLFTPRRQVTIEFVEPDDVPRNGDKMQLNRYLEAFYNAVEQPALAVPRYFWQGSAPRALPCAAAAGEFNVLGDVADATREKIYALLRESAGLPSDHPITPQQLLSADLGIDSLALMEVATGIEAEFGYPVPGLEPLVTVDDCLQAAIGKLFTEQEGARPIPPAWFAQENHPDGQELAALPEGVSTLTQAFLYHARRAPSRPLLADKNGIRTRFQVLVGALVLARRFAALQGTRLGIMLPAAPAAPVVWLAAQLAGKEPVMLNWTVGLANMRHCIALSGITHVVTANALLDQLARQGNDLASLPVAWVAVDALAAELSLVEKLRGAVRARLHCLGIYPIHLENTQTTAVMLFTSGSESSPKGVPLSHENIMSNARDVAAVLGIQQKERILAMLPPFHSFGFMVGVALPLGGGLATAFHSNPTESASLTFLIRDFKLTLLGATPTFLEGILNRAKNTDTLRSLRYAFVGAEKCPDRVYRAFAASCPSAALCEGYGITECSPVVSVNRPSNILAGSIGHVLPSVHIALVEGESGKAADTSVVKGEVSKAGDTLVTLMRRVPVGETGMLLVRGPSIFSGYASAPSSTPPNPFMFFEGVSWYRTGDLVQQDESGRLHFMGRLKRFVKIGGEMISLPQMESTLLEALRDNPKIPDDGKPWLAIEVRPGSEDAGAPEILAFARIPVLAHELNSLLKAAGLSSLYAVKQVVAVNEIPVLGTGKIDYRALVENVA